MTLEQKLNLVVTKTNDEIPKELELPALLLEAGLNHYLNPSSAKSYTQPVLAAFSELLNDYGGNTLLELTSQFLPVENRKSVTARTLPPLTTTGVLACSYISLLKLLATSGPAIGTDVRGVTMHRHAHGLLVTVYLAESSDGVALSKGLGHDMINNIVTGFVKPPTEPELVSLAQMTPEEVDAFVYHHPMVSTAICTILMGVSGTASSLVTIDYRSKLGTAQDIAESRKPLLAMVKKCASCLEANVECSRVYTDDPCLACKSKHCACIVGELVSFSSDCESGVLGG